MELYVTPKNHYTTPTAKVCEQTTTTSLPTTTNFESFGRVARFVLTSLDPFVAAPTCVAATSN